MASPTQWTWVWVNSGSWWGTARPGMLQSMGSQKIWHDWATWTELKRVWDWSMTRKSLPITPCVTHMRHRQSYYLPHTKGICVYISPVYRGLVCYHQSNFKCTLLLTRGSLICYHVNWHGNPLQYSHLENPMDRGAWQATVRKITKNQTWLKRLSMHKHTCTICLYCTELRWCTLSQHKGCETNDPAKDTPPCILGTMVLMVWSLEWGSMMFFSWVSTQENIELQF